MKSNQFWFSLMFLISIATLFLFGAALSVWSNPSKGLLEFNVTPETVYLNWTTSYQSNITITVNDSVNRNVTINILNNTASTYYPDSGLTPNYTQGYPTTLCNRIGVNIINASGYYFDSVGPLNGTGITNSSNVTLSSSHIECYPGRYYTNRFLIANSSNTTENLNITIFFDIPIVVNNSLNSPTGLGTFNGSLPANATTYQSYYFFILNSTSMTNATGVMINITGWSSSQDVDLFLFKNNNYVAKSVNKSSTNELIRHSFFPNSLSGNTWTNDGVWEIRIYGNSSSSSTISWQGIIYFTTLNSTNSSNTNQQVTIIDLGPKNTSSLDHVNITLKNEGNMTLSNLAETKELYYVKRFTGNINKNFTVLVPDSSIAKKMKVSLNWTGATNYSFEVYSQSNSLIFSSKNKYYYGNVSGAMQEEFGDTLSIPSSSEIWTIRVINYSQAQDNYNLSVFFYVNESLWIATNFTTVTLNRTSLPNYTTTVRINFTIQNNSLDGIYEGSINYLDNNKAGITIPIKINVTTPMLLINNSFSTFVARVDEDYGATLNKTLTLVLTNNGSYPVTFNVTNSSSKLSCVSGSCTSAYFANFTYNTTTIWSILPGEFIFVNVSVVFNGSMPTGIYDGSILFNTTNETLAFNSHPYQTVNVTVRLNITNYLDVRIIQFQDTVNTADQIFGNHNAFSGELDMAVDVYYINGSGPITSLNTANFTGVWLQEGNVSGTTGRVPSSGLLTVYNITNPVYCTAACPFAGLNHYFINVTVPAFVPGGLYAVGLSVNVSGNSNLNGTFTGAATNRTLWINSTGMYAQSNTSSSQTLDSTTTYFLYYVNVSNFGPVSASSSTIQPSIALSESCSGWEVDSDGSYYSCPWGSVSPSSTKTNFTFTLLPGFNTSCIVYWKIKNSTTSADACTGNISGSPNGYWFNNLSVSVTVSGAGGTTTTTTTQTDNRQTSQQEQQNITTDTTTTYLDIITYHAFIYVQQGKSNSTTVVVNNTNSSVDQSVTLKVEGINSSWVSVSPSVQTIAKATTASYSVTFSVTNDSDVKDYSGKFTAASNYSSVSKNFTLRILPGEKKKVEINSTLQEYISNFTKLWLEVNQTKQHGYNVSEVEPKLNLLKEKIEEAKNYVYSGTDEGYFTALQLFTDIKSLFDETRSALNQAKQQKEGLLAGLPDWVNYVLIGGGITGTVVLAYLFWPTKVTTAEKYGKKEEYKFKPKEEGKILKGNPVDKIKEIWKRISERRKKFEYNYKGE